MSIIDIFGFRSTQAQTAHVPNAQMSPMPSRGGIIKSTSNTINNTDKVVGEVITSLKVGTAGNLVVQTPAGNLIPYLNVLAGQTIYGKFAAVLSAGTIDGLAMTTTADDICWYGGEM